MSTVADDSLESLLRDACDGITDGRICLTAVRGGWYGGVAHFGGHHTHCPAPHGDPVEALRVALIEDIRRTADVKRRYEAAPKLGDAPADDFDTIDDFEGLA